MLLNIVKQSNFYTEATVETTLGLGRDGELETVSIVFNFSLVRYFTPRSLLVRPH